MAGKKCNRWLCALFFVFLPALNTPATPEKPGFALGAEVGWGAAYGISLQVSWYPLAPVEIYSGLGFNFSGAKTGLGLRTYLPLFHGLDLHGGVAWAWSSGLKHLNLGIRDKNSESVYRMPGGHLLHPRAGVRVVPHETLAIVFSLGYGFALYDDKPTLVSGIDVYGSVANLYQAGGIEVSAALQWLW